MVWMKLGLTIRTEHHKSVLATFPQTNWAWPIPTEQNMRWGRVNVALASSFFLETPPLDLSLVTAPVPAEAWPPRPRGPSPPQIAVSTWIAAAGCSPDFESAGERLQTQPPAPASRPPLRRGLLLPPPQ